jgi:hypothetical protein
VIFGAVKRTKFFCSGAMLVKWELLAPGRANLLVQLLHCVAVVLTTPHLVIVTELLVSSYSACHPGLIWSSLLSLWCCEN